MEVSNMDINPNLVKKVLDLYQDFYYEVNRTIGEGQEDKIGLIASNLTLSYFMGVNNK